MSYRDWEADPRQQRGRHSARDGWSTPDETEFGQVGRGVGGDRDEYRRYDDSGLAPSDRYDADITYGDFVIDDDAPRGSRGGHWSAREPGAGTQGWSPPDRLDDTGVWTRGAHTGEWQRPDDGWPARPDPEESAPPDYRPTSWRDRPDPPPRRTSGPLPEVPGGTWSSGIDNSSAAGSYPSSASGGSYSAPASGDSWPAPGDPWSAPRDSRPSSGDSRSSPGDTWSSTGGSRSRSARDDPALDRDWVPPVDPWSGGDSRPGPAASRSAPPVPRSAPPAPRSAPPPGGAWMVPPADQDRPSAGPGGWASPSPADSWSSPARPRSAPRGSGRDGHDGGVDDQASYLPRRYARPELPSAESAPPAAPTSSGAYTGEVLPRRRRRDEREHDRDGGTSSFDGFAAGNRTPAAPTSAGRPYEDPSTPRGRGYAEGRDERPRYPDDETGYRGRRARRSESQDDEPRYREDASSRDAGYRDTGYRDTGYRDSTSRDSGYQDTGYRDTGYRDTGYQDTGYRDAGREPERPGSGEAARRDERRRRDEPRYRDEPGYRDGSGYPDEEHAYRDRPASRGESDRPSPGGRTDPRYRERPAYREDSGHTDGPDHGGQRAIEPYRGESARRRRYRDDPPYAEDRTERERPARDRDFADEPVRRPRDGYGEYDHDGASDRRDRADRADRQRHGDPLPGRDVDRDQSHGRGQAAYGRSAPDDPRPGYPPPVDGPRQGYPPDAPGSGYPSREYRESRTPRALPAAPEPGGYRNEPTAYRSEPGGYRGDPPGYRAGRTNDRGDTGGARGQANIADAAPTASAGPTSYRAGSGDYRGSARVAGAYPTNERRRPIAALPPAPRRAASVYDIDDEDDELADEPVPGGYLASAAYTGMWFAVPMVLWVLWSLTLNNEASANCIDDAGLPCASERTEALSTLTDNLPQMIGTMLIAVVIALALRFVNSSWKASTVGFAAAVVGGGLTTVGMSIITGQPLG